MAADLGVSGWADWSTAAFTRAQVNLQPVALLVETRWSEPCHRFRHEVLEDAGVASALGDGYVAVCVDADVRPDVAERYTADGWPTLVVLTPHGWPMAPVPISDPAACAARLREISGAFDRRRADILREVPVSEAAAARAPGLVDHDPAAVVAEWLERWHSGGMMAAETPRAIEVSMSIGRRSGRDDLVRGAVDVLERLAASPLRDEATGAWFRVAPAADEGCEAVQLADDQAAWLSVELGAQDVEPTEARARRIASLVATLERAFAGRHGFANARFCPTRLREDARTAFADACRRDERVFVDTQARLGSVLVCAGRVLDMPALTSRAVDRLDAMVAAAYQRDGGVAHVFDPAPRLRGLLGDQVAVAAALLGAWDASARVVYLDAADELLQSTVKKFTDGATGLLRDRIPTTAGAGDVGLLGQPLFPTDANVTAAGCLLQLAVCREAPDRRHLAHALLEGCLARVDRRDPANASLLATLA